MSLSITSQDLLAREGILELHMAAEVRRWLQLGEPLKIVIDRGNLSARGNGNGGSSVVSNCLNFLNGRAIQWVCTAARDFLPILIGLKPIIVFRTMKRVVQ